MAQTGKKPRVPADYNEYRLTAAQTLGSALALGLVAAAVAYVFYMNVIIAAAALLVGLAGPRMYKRMLIAKRRKALNLQFKDFLYALNSSMSAGKSLKEALVAARDDMRVLYMDDRNIMIQELDAMAVKLEMSARVTTLMSDLARRSGNEDIRSFATVLESGETKGIDQIQLIQKTVRVISEKLEVKQEIETKVASVKMEQKVMLAMPVLLTLMMNLMAPDYMQTLYEHPLGYLIVTVVVALLGISVVWSNRIMDINV